MSTTNDPYEFDIEEGVHSLLPVRTDEAEAESPTSEGRVARWFWNYLLRE